MSSTVPGLLLCWAAGLVVVWLPGLAILSLVDDRASRGLLLHLAFATGVGLSFWPVLLLLTSTAGHPWGPAATRALLTAFALFLAARALRRRGAALRRPLLETVLVAGVLALTGVTRVLHVRDLALPPWVDSVHHAFVAQLIVQQGHIPLDYAPVLPDLAASYHWGFHAVLAATAWLLGVDEPFDLSRLLLHFGQLLNVLVALALYAGARTLFRSRAAGVVAALLAGLVSWFPAYYLAWGRYPQLAGTLILVPLAIAIWRLRSPAAGARAVAVAGLLAAGLFLVHVRVVFFAATLVAVLSPLLLRRNRLRTLLRLVSACAVAAVLSGPWVWTLTRRQEASRVLPPRTEESLARWKGYNVIPTELLLAPNARELIAVASIGLTGLVGWAGMPVAGRLLSGALWLGVLVAERPRKRISKSFRTRFPWLPLGILWTWAGLSVLLVNLDRFGLPPLRFVPNSVVVLLAFLPVCTAAGGIAAWGLRCLPAPLRTPPLAAAALAGAAIWGASQMVDVVAPWTILATTRDRVALEWIATHVSRDPVFAVRAMPWVGGTIVGRDGGYWLSVLTGRRSLVPPALYPFLPDATRGPLQARLEAWAATTDLADPAAIALLREAGVTHLFVGENDGPLTSAAISRVPSARAVYRDGPVAVYELRLGAGLLPGTPGGNG